MASVSDITSWMDEYLCIVTRFDFESRIRIRPSLAKILGHLQNLRDSLVFNNRLSYYVKEVSSEYCILEFRLLNFLHSVYGVGYSYEYFDHYIVKLVRCLSGAESLRLLSMSYLNVDELLTDDREFFRWFGRKLVENEDNLNLNIKKILKESRREKVYRYNVDEVYDG